MSYLPVAREQTDDRGNSKGDSMSGDSKENLSAVTHTLLHHPVYSHLKCSSVDAESQITSSLFFQQLIYFNWFYSILECYLYFASQVHRFMYFDMEYGVPVRVIVILIFGCLEVCRLQNAFYGNIRESFPQICAFIMLSLLTVTAQLILLGGVAPTSPLEWTLLFYGVIFHLLEMVVCICTMGKLTQTQKALFLWRMPKGQSSKL